jgi:hypothetical protein
MASSQDQTPPASLLGRRFNVCRNGFCLPAQEDVASFSHCSFSLSDPEAFVHRAGA